MKISGRNVNDLFYDALWGMKVEGVKEESRNGKVITIPEPVLIQHTRPRERVIFCQDRKENPVFHFMECLWMMSGNSAVDWLLQFNPRMNEFAEKGGTLHGAYGFRWRYAYALDQVKEIVKMLKADPTTRRAVISMWDPILDLNADKKDLPCNTQIYFRVRGKAMDMTVCNRSNDLVWGALGSNVVHFSFLQELIAHAADLVVGSMYQFTNNLHIYERHWHFLDIPPACESYTGLRVQPYRILNGTLHNWLRDCEDFVGGAKTGFKDPFFEDVAIPILNQNVAGIRALDWREACLRYWERKSDDKGSVEHHAS